LSSGAIEPGWPVDGVPLLAVGTAGVAHAVPDGTGGAFVAWDDGRDTQFGWQYFELYAQHVLANGALDPLWGANGLRLWAAPISQSQLNMSPDGGGGVELAWMDARDPWFQLYGIHLNADGTRVAGWSQYGNAMATTTSGFSKEDPKVVSDGTGGFYGFWVQDRGVGPTRIYGQHMVGDGTVRVSWDPTGDDLSLPNEGQRCEDEAVCADGFGGALVAFFKALDMGPGIMAVRVMADGPVPTLISFGDSELEPGGVVLRWEAPQADQVRATVQRTSDGSTWVTLGAPSVQGSDLLVFEDRGLQAGRYGYRLEYAQGTGTAETDPVWIQVPGSAVLSLAGFRPNPARRDGAISFSLGDSKPAQVVVRDVRGRVLRSMEVSNLGPGPHVVKVGTAFSLRPGVYWLELRAGGRVLRAKGVVLD